MQAELKKWFLIRTTPIISALLINIKWSMILPACPVWHKNGGSIGMNYSGEIILLHGHNIMGSRLAWLALYSAVFVLSREDRGTDLPWLVFVSAQPPLSLSLSLSLLGMNPKVRNPVASPPTARVFPPTLPRSQMPVLKIPG